MDIDLWKVQYEQLNQRARWYSSQVWYIPFAYIGLIGIGLEKILSLPQPLMSIALVLMGIFSIAVFVHVSSIKYYERLAVREMRELERVQPKKKPISRGGSCWYLSFAWYIRLMLFILTYVFMGYGMHKIGTWLLITSSCWWPITEAIIMIVLSICYGIMINKNHSLNKTLMKKIRDDDCKKRGIPAGKGAGDEVKT